MKLIFKWKDVINTDEMLHNSHLNNAGFGFFATMFVLVLLLMSYSNFRTSLLILLGFFAIIFLMARIYWDTKYYMFKYFEWRTP